MSMLPETLRTRRDPIASGPRRLNLNLVRRLGAGPAALSATRPATWAAELRSRPGAWDLALGELIRWWPFWAVVRGHSGTTKMGQGSDQEPSPDARLKQ